MPFCSHVQAEWAAIKRRLWRLYSHRFFSIQKDGGVSEAENKKANKQTSESRLHTLSVQQNPFRAFCFGTEKSTESRECNHKIIPTWTWKVGLLRRLCTRKSEIPHTKSVPLFILSLFHLLISSDCKHGLVTRKRRNSTDPMKKSKH